MGAENCEIIEKMMICGKKKKKKNISEHDLLCD